MAKRGVVWGGVGVAALVVVGGLHVAESQCQRGQNAYRAQAAQNHRGQGVTQFAIDRSFLPCLVERVTADAQSGDPSYKEERDLAAQEASAGMAFWIALIALCQLVATIWGLLYIRGTLRATLKAVEDTSEATEAMRSANVIAENTAERQLRAYVVGKDHVVEQFFNNGRAKFIVRLHNSGQTPAYEVRCVTLVRATDEDVDAYRFLFRKSEKFGVFSNAIIGAGDFHVLENRAKTSLAHADWAAIVSGQVKMIFCGIVSYRDVFGKRHLTTFRYYFDPDGDIKSTAFDLSPCATGNEAN